MVLPNIKNNNYTDSDIDTLPTFLQMRLRPAMYIGDLYMVGFYKCLLELIQNVIDEYGTGVCDLLDINISTKNNKLCVIVEDTGRGIPFGRLIRAFAVINTSGKYGDTAYDFSAGKNGVGSKVINAYSTDLIVSVKRDKQIKTVEWHYKSDEDRIDPEKNCIENTIDIESESTGTKVIWYPDVPFFKLDLYSKGETVFNTTLRDLDTFLKLTSRSCKGLKIQYTFNDNKTKEYFIEKETPPSVILEDYLSERKIPTIFKNGIDITNTINEYRNSENNFVLECAFNYRNNPEIDDINMGLISYVNRLNTVGGGTHVDSFRTTISRALTEVLKDDTLIPREYKKLRDKYKGFSGTEISYLIVGFVNLLYNKAEYDSQTKERMKSEDARSFMTESVYDLAKKHFSKNRNETIKLASIIGQKLLVKEKTNSIKKETYSNITSIKDMDSNLLDKYTMAIGVVRTLCELFIVEGDSAAGNMKTYRVSAENQGIVSIRGKFLNCRGMDPKVVFAPGEKEGNQEAKALLKILGCGYGDNYNPNKLRYHKIIIASDADKDGDHIKTLLLCFFWEFFPQFFKAGEEKVFIVQPPLFRLYINKSSFIDMIDEMHGMEILTSIYSKTFNLYLSSNEDKSKDTLVPENIFKQLLFTMFGGKTIDGKNYIFESNNYLNIIDNFTTVSGIKDPYLLETIAVNYYNLMKGVISDKFSALGYKINKKTTVKDKIVTYEFEKGREVFNVIFNEEFLKIINKILIKLKEINFLKDPYLKHEKSGDEFSFSFTWYNVLTIAKSCIKSENMTRYKGLGEMEEPDQIYSILDPATRNIIKVSSVDYESSDNIMEIMMGKGKENVIAKNKILKND